MSQQDVPAQGQGRRPAKTLTNRRATVRYLCAPATPGRVVRVETQELQRAWVLDLSRGGVGLLVSLAIPDDQAIHVVLKSAAGRSYELPARVARSTRQPDGDWVLGCELLTQLSDDDLDALLQ
jgi:hypothetical protein